MIIMIMMMMMMVMMMVMMMIMVMVMVILMIIIVIIIKCTLFCSSLYSIEMTDPNFGYDRQEIIEGVLFNFFRSWYKEAGISFLLDFRSSRAAVVSHVVGLIQAFQVCKEPS